MLAPIDELLTATLTAPTTLSCLNSGLNICLSWFLPLASIWTPTKYAIYIDSAMIRFSTTEQLHFGITYSNPKLLINNDLMYEKFHNRTLFILRDHGSKFTYLNNVLKLLFFSFYIYFKTQNLCLSSVFFFFFFQNSFQGEHQKGVFDCLHSSDLISNWSKWPHT